jgi:hypothetical protein
MTWKVKGRDKNVGAGSTKATNKTLTIISFFMLFSITRVDYALGSSLIPKGDYGLNCLLNITLLGRYLLLVNMSLGTLNHI